MSQSKNPTGEDCDRAFVWLVGFLTPSTTRLYRGRAPRQSVWQFYVLPHMRQRWETMTSISAGHIILTPTQPQGRIEPGTSSPGVMRSTDWGTAPPPPPPPCGRASKEEPQVFLVIIMWNKKQALGYEQRISKETMVPQAEPMKKSPDS